MDKKTALAILIRHSFLLSDSVKQQLINNVATLNETQVDILGKLLAKEKLQSIQNAPQQIKTMDELILKMEQVLNKK